MWFVHAVLFSIKNSEKRKFIVISGRITAYDLKDHWFLDLRFDTVFFSGSNRVSFDRVAFVKYNYASPKGINETVISELNKGNLKKVDQFVKAA